MIFVPTVNLIVQQKIVEHPLQACQLSSFEPGEHVSSKGHVHPFTKIFGFGNSHFAELRPDRDSWIWREDVWGKADIGKLSADVTHGLERDDAVGLCFSGVAEDKVKDDTNAAKLRLAR